MWANAWVVFRRAPEVVAVAGLLWISWCVLGAAGLFVYMARRFFAYMAEKPLYTGVRTGYHYLISLSVCLAVCLSACLSVCV